MPTMSISHQIVIDEAGKPTAALIPWAEFELLREELEDNGEVTPEEAAAIAEAKRDLAAGNREAFQDLDEFMAECNR